MKNGDLGSIIYTPIKFRAPWDLLLPSFREGNMTVAGDAMHVMGPFMGQGAASALEDAVVLARCLAQGMCNRNVSSWQLQKSIGKALDKYVRERRIRVIRLSMQTFLRQSMQLPLPVPVKLVILLFLVAIFGKPLSHSQYNCGPLWNCVPVTHNKLLLCTVSYLLFFFFEGRGILHVVYFKTSSSLYLIPPVWVG